MRHVFQHAARDGRHAGHDKHIAHVNTRCAGDRIDDQGRPLRDACHALAAFIKRSTGLGIPSLDHLQRVGPHVDAHIECGCDGIRGDVIMCGADTTGGKHICHLRTQLIDRVDDGVMDIRNGAALNHANALWCQEKCDLLQVFIGGPAGENFVTDEDYRRCYCIIIDHLIHPRATFTRRYRKS